MITGISKLLLKHCYSKTISAKSSKEGRGSISNQTGAKVTFERVVGEETIIQGTLKPGEEITLPPNADGINIVIHGQEDYKFTKED
jgi:hypothetical protein